MSTSAENGTTSIFSFRRIASTVTDVVNLFYGRASEQLFRLSDDALAARKIERQYLGRHLVHRDFEL